MTDVSALTIAEAGDMLSSRAITSVELTELTLKRAEATEPVLHAYARLLPDMAREAARQADRELARGIWRGPLHGIPLAVKDIFYVAGAPTEAGSHVLRGFVPPYDASVVTALRKAGAVLIGKTITHEFAWGANVVPTRNPWQLDCFPGGSSAGSGVSVAVGSAFGALGSDTGGSIRIPAVMNGIVGLKPTFGRVSRYGVVPLGSSLDHVGPLTRSVEDCALLLQAIAGYDPQDSGSIDLPVPDYRDELEAGVGGMVIGVERDHYFYSQVSDEVRSATEAVIVELERQGARFVTVKMPELDLGFLVGLTILLAESSMYHRRWLRERPMDYETGTRILIELGEHLPATHYLTAQRARAVIKNRMKELFRAHGLDAMISPTIPITTVPVAEMERMDETGESPRTVILHHSFSANVTGQPALTAPCGFDSAGLPIGFQLLGQPFGEQTLFRIARAYERTTGWHRRRPPVEAAGSG
ncbi:MAG: Asp-tRNA(Asn)/Glu-tRNA(Gln) amidotransferase GatCAB subunit A [Candidatus Nephthysia bennettiae]|uniref:Amidase n=1 Tax=Candidatus Nephthysia bennettiae TaxID=3127016 RepID=A0A934KD78_9BACT|nr:amidase [Candidatus Dormibacteraeota bacterium]MBJ7613389.1 amidase [Candidatus Dormibacteraeota bacterium]PZR86761.1 MAG: Asp-tRNA(Asn)/Glu-tRNA(Gln) amidotransferase GatCAB subunit A [Candidatus Dormibacteraeota bacterium]